MTVLALKVQFRQSQKLNADLKAQVRGFIAAEQNARNAAARLATSRSRGAFRRKREVVVGRPGRNSGRMLESIDWAIRPSDGMVALKVATLNKQAPYWIIQEIGTGQRAITRQANSPRAVGRPKKGATYVKTVRPQKGRRIRAGLVFATRGGVFSPPGSATGQQLHLRSQVRARPGTPLPWSGRGSQAGIVIKREIQGQHFIQKGGESGFRQYRRSTLAAARSQFKAGRR